MNSGSQTRGLAPRRLAVLPLLLLLVAATSVPAQAPSYAKQVRPFLDTYCVGCHKGKGGKGGLDLSTYAGMLKGGISFDAVVPGKPDESYAVLMAEKKKKPHMPPKEAKAQPKPEEVALLRAWVSAGARNDSGQSGAAPAPRSGQATASAREAALPLRRMPQKRRRRPQADGPRQPTV
jgi:hypothetical protein